MFIKNRIAITIFKRMLLALACFGFLPGVQAVLPAPDGGYPGGNTAEGQAALFSLTTGGFNTAVGLFSLRALTDGDFNTAVGAGTLLANTADANTAAGAGALLSNTTGARNTANGAFALFSNTTGTSNTAVGKDALFTNTTGFENTACGAIALRSNINGQGNTAIGAAALNRNTGAGFNTAIGDFALSGNTTGIQNIALGFDAGRDVTTADNVICIGHPGANVDNSCFIDNIFGKSVGNDAVVVLIDSFGKLGTTGGSSRRFKTEIKPMDKTSEAILAFQPVTFHYKSDATSTSQFGLIAEEVAKINPDLVVRDKNGEIYTVRYDAVNAMLLNEFLKEHRKVREHEATIALLKRDSAKQQKQIEALTAGLRRVSDQIQLTNPAPHLVSND